MADPARGLLVIWASLRQEDLDDYLEWHNCEHIPERLRIPGFRVAHRYRASEEATRFLMAYETGEAQTMKSEPYLYAQNHPTPWTKKNNLRFRRNFRGIYSLRVSAGGAPGLDAPYACILRFNLPREAWQRDMEEHLTQICRTPGIYRGRLYELDENISNIMTVGRQIHGAGPPGEHFLAFYEVASREFSAFQGWEEGKRTPPSAHDLSFEFYRRDFVMHRPNPLPGRDI